MNLEISLSNYSVFKMVTKQHKKDLVLVVDDQPNNLKILSSVINKKYSLSAAPNGTSALQILEKIKPDLILMDIMMPGMNGFEVCERIKENHNTKEIPVIFLTAKTEIEDIIRGFELGAVDFIFKPFVPKEILARIENHLNFSRAKKIISFQEKEIAELKNEIQVLKEKSNI